MTRDIAEILKAKISELQKNVILLKSAAISINRENLKDDIIKYWGIERGLQISIECIIDIANILIASSEMQKPDTYRETILLLSKLNILPGNFSSEIANMVSFRNILVHDYLKIDGNIMIDILNNHLDDFAKFIKYVNDWVNKNK